jgi:hypothetical protein
MALAGQSLDQFVKTGLIESMMKAANES